MKVARWNDINYYALKQTVEKTHRTLHKHMKQFENILRQPIRSVLTDGSSDWSDMAQSEASAPSNKAIDRQVFISSCENVQVGWMMKLLLSTFLMNVFRLMFYKYTNVDVPGSL